MDHAADDRGAVAVIGYDGRFPGARNVQELWQNLREGVSCIRQFSASELEAHGVPADDLAAPNYVRAAAIVDDIECFDASFFGITPREAELMDPQQRLFLEVCWGALEHAGYDPGGFSDPVGVFAGARTNTYLLHILRNEAFARTVGAFHLGLANDLGFMTTRLSHCLNLTGPSCAVQTACSTSLVAVHLAVRSLRAGECRVAVAGGAAINVPHVAGYVADDGSVFSPDGTCRVFDGSARGTVFGSGVAVVVLKRLADAVADRDDVHAVIMGSAINNDGSAKASFTAPAVRGQVAVIEDALRDAGVAAGSIGYVEAHATGTLLGDAIEVRALARAYRRQTDREAYCALGSVKSNVGHLDAAAGVTGLIKAIQCLEHRLLVPTLHYERPNPQIELAGSPFYVSTRAAEWPSPGGPRRAAVSAFGVGGTNAHVIVEEGPPRAPSDAGRPWQLLVWSGKSVEAVADAERQLVRFLRDSPDVPLADAAFTLQTGRQRMPWRRAAVCRDTAEAMTALQSGGDAANVGETDETATVVFVFPGEGAQHPGMGRDLYEREPVFRDAIDRCARLLGPELGVDIRPAMYGGPEAGSSMDEIRLAQPALFATEYALATLWRSWGVRPAAMLGHGLGEYVAACVAGVLALEDALRLVALRARLMQEMPRGAALAIELGEDAVGSWLDGDVWVSAVDGEDACRVGGDERAVAGLERALRAAGHGVQRIGTPHADHTPLMAVMADRVAAEVAHVRRGSIGVPYVSNVTGAWVRDDEVADAGYWGRQEREPVQFARGLETLLDDGGRFVLEAGPGQGLTRLIRRRGGTRVCASMARAGQSDLEAALRALAQAWVAGADVDWHGFHAGTRRNRVALPTYPFQRTRHWIEAPAAAARQAAPRRTARIPKLDDVSQWFWTPSWTLAPPAAPAAPRERAGERWLVFADGCGLAARLAPMLRSSGADVVTVSASAGAPARDWQRTAPDAFTIDPADADHYRRLAAALGEEGRGVEHVVHAWGIVQPGEAPDGPECFDAFQPAGFHSLLHIARELGGPSGGTLRSCWVVSSDSQDAESLDRPHPARSGAVAFCKILSQETDVRARFLDVAGRDLAADAEAVARGVVQAIDLDSPDVVTALRGRRRWVAGYARLRVDEAGPPRFPLRDGGVYLITGGLGGVGRLMAAQMAECCRARLVLTSREPLPPRGTWPDEAGLSALDPRLAGRIRAVRAIEAAGGAVCVLAADASSAEAMRAVVETCCREWGGVDGVVHAAGVTSGDSLFRTVHETTPEHCGEQARPKVHGLYAIERAIEGRPVDFVLAMSSNASVLGGLGFLSYAAANAAMDAFVASRAVRPGRTRWLAANWDHWPQETRKYLDVSSSMDEYAMTREEAARASQIVWSRCDRGQVVVATGDLQARLALWLNRDRQAPQAEPSRGPAATAALGSRPKLQTPYVAPATPVEETMAGIWATYLGVSPIGIHDDYFELGGHSLMAIQMVQELGRALNREVALRTLFEGPTIAQLARACTADACPADAAAVE